MIWGELAALGTAVCWSFTAIFFSYAGRRVGADVVNRSRLLFACLYLVVAHRLLEGAFFPTNVEPFRWSWLAVSSLLGLVLGDAFLFRAYVLIGPRLAMLLMSTVPIFSAVFGRLLFNEAISGVEAAGILLAIAGIVWVVTEGRPEGQGSDTHADRQQYRRGLLFAFLGALGQVTNLVAARYALVDDFPTLSATLIRIVIALVVLWGAAAARGQVGPTLRHWGDRRVLRAILLGAFVGPFLGIWLSLVAVQHARLGIASTLMALPPVLLIPLEFAAFRQRVSRRGIAGTVVALAGVALLFWR